MPMDFDLSNWQPDIIIEEEGIQLCEQLGLIETIQQGHDTYVRPTQKGINVLHSMLMVAVRCSDGALMGTGLQQN